MGGSVNIVLGSQLSWLQVQFHLMAASQLVAASEGVSALL